jgi:nucleoside-diphosphate-sugar epimerase
VAGFETILKSTLGLGSTFNLGTGFEISILDTVKLIADIMGVEVEIASENARIRPENSEVERLLADTSRTQATFGWKPAHTGPEGLRQGLEKTVEWFSKPDNLSRYKAETYNT